MSAQSITSSHGGAGIFPSDTCNTPETLVSGCTIGARRRRAPTGRSPVLMKHVVTNADLSPPLSCPDGALPRRCGCLTIAAQVHMHAAVRRASSLANRVRRMATRRSRRTQIVGSDRPAARRGVRLAPRAACCQIMRTSLPFDVDGGMEHAMI